MTTTEQFIDAVSRTGARVLRADDTDSLRSALIDLTRDRRVLVDDIAAVAGLELGRPPTDPWEAEVGVVEAFSAAAESGSVALVQRPGHRRATSILPHDLVIIVPTAAIRPSYQAMVDDIAALTPPPTGVQIVAGASRSGDIESAMIHGMHGPSAVTVVTYGAPGAEGRTARTAG